MRLQRFIASCTSFSRRKAEQLIDEQKVKVNGKLITKQGVIVDPTKDLVEIDNKPIKKPKDFIYIMLNKPSGYLSTCKDTHDRKTVLNLIPYKDLYPVGRLDQNTEGLLILTNDGDLTYEITHPKFEHEKVYLVKTKSEITEDNVQKLERGIMLNGKKTKSCAVEIKSQKACHITLQEGRKRQIRRMFDEIKNPVIYLKRIRIGGLRLSNLKKGEYRKLTPADLNKLR